MPLHLTKIAYGAKSYADLEGWYAGRDEVRIHTRYRPTRHAECIGGSLFWILDHALVSRSTILGFAEQPDGRWWIELEPRLVRVQAAAKRAHQGWRYLKPAQAPRDLADGEAAGDAIPGRMLRKLAQLGLV